METDRDCLWRGFAAAGREFEEMCVYYWRGLLKFLQAIAEKF